MYRKFIIGNVLVLMILAGCSPAASPQPAPSPTPIVEQALPPAAGVEPTAAQITPQAIATPALPQPVPSIPNPANYAWQEVAGGFSRPVALVAPPDGSTRLFVVEQTGAIRITQDGQVLAPAFLDVSGRITTAGNEQGLLGLAFHPEYAHNGYFYLNYTNRDGNTVIARYRVSADPLLADDASEYILIQVPQPYGNHNGGGLAFGPDGYLYIGLGDGGSAGDPEGNAQSLDSLLGKMLRIDVNQPETGYRIPLDNPYSGGGGLPEIWALGLRNPWRFSFDRVTGDLWIGDVGQNKYEEVDFLPAGSPAGVNFGWDYREGVHSYEGQAPAGLALIDPVWEYDHTQGCSITGGVVYRGIQLSEWQGVYLFADYCNGNIWGLIPDGGAGWTATSLFQTGANISSFGQDAAGEVYFLDLRGRVLGLVQR
ncbi:MAG: glucose dehydrogenase [Anaerolineae bacterium]|nr:glucose dehydrogenase [Anaerolineae bacterium]